MFGLNTITIYLIIGLAFSNLITGFAWWIADTRLESATAETIVCATRHEAFVANVKAEGAKAEHRTAEIISKNTTIVEDIKHEYQTAIDRVRNDYAGRLRQQANRGSGGGVLPSVSGPTFGPNAAGTDSIPAPERVAADCAETTITLNYVQTFIEQQAEVSKP